MPWLKTQFPFKTALLLFLLFPALNFVHESGHWIGAKSIGANPKMMLQRVDVGGYQQFNFLQRTVYNWGGPATNYAIIAASLIYTPLIPVGFVMSVHRLGPNLFALGLYSVGNRGFTNDETKQFPPRDRIWVAGIFSLLYFGLSLFLLLKWMPQSGYSIFLPVVLMYTVVWLGYGMFLDFIDKKLWM